MLPIFPRSVWNRLIPAARRGVQARDAVKTEIAKWEAAGGVAYASEVYRNINEALNATGASPEDRACWINMVVGPFERGSLTLSAIRILR